VIGISPTQLRRVPPRVGIAGGGGSTRRYAQR
jgi:hypothetical protein